jgi:hypothetical protein
MRRTGHCRRLGLGLGSRAGVYPSANGSNWLPGDLESALADALGINRGFTRGYRAGNPDARL